MMCDWGMIDDNATNFRIEGQGEEVFFAVKFATALPNVRYVCEFRSSPEGRGARISQFLRVNPRVAFIMDGYRDWFQEVKGQLA